MDSTYTDLLNSLFDYLPEYKLIVCRLHRTCVLPYHLQTHLHEQHNLSSATCRALLQELRTQFETRPLL